MKHSTPWRDPKPGRAETIAITKPSAPLTSWWANCSREEFSQRAKDRQRAMQATGKVYPHPVQREEA